MTKEEIQSKLEAAEKQLEEIESLKTEIESLKSKSNPATQKWFLWYNHNLNIWIVDDQREYDGTTIYFTTEEAAQKAADWMNKYAKKDGEKTTN